MFQFPGFAFLTLCIQVKNTWFNFLVITEVINRKLSGGLPHSEIHGSKLILSSPWLIAEYHVFHRLLLPRHSPNALFALDLIQKKKDLIFVLPRGALLEDICMSARSFRCTKTIASISAEAGKKLRVFSWTKSILFPLASCRWSKHGSIRADWTWLVYLTWTTPFVSAGRHREGRGNNL